MILIDLQKAFDTIDHPILLMNMKYLGFSKNAIVWFKSYLSEQKYKININTSYSSPSNLIYVVSQRSKLGPLLLLLYNMISLVIRYFMLMILPYFSNIKM